MAGGDFNAAGSGQRWGYSDTTMTKRADAVLDDVASQPPFSLFSSDGPTYWSGIHSQTHAATLDHFLLDRKLGSAPVVFDRPSWHPSHDHHAIFCCVPLSYLPGRAQPFRRYERRPGIDM
eukprot:689484-Rhodomonas_salina.1